MRIRGVMTELSSSARTIGTGKKNTSWKAVIVNVLPTALRNSGLLKTLSKLDQPAQVLLMNPEYGE